MTSKFQDDFFQDYVAEKGEATVADDRSYRAKQCPYEWYMKATNEDPQSLTQIMKYRADRAYNRGDFATAVTIYLQLLGNARILPSNMEREVMESVARSYLKLGQFREALSASLALCRLSANNKDHRTCTLMLLRKVYHTMKNYSNAALTCIELLEMHPLNMNFWGLFAESLTHLWRISLSVSGRDEIVTHVDTNLPFSLKTLSLTRMYQILGCCFMRIRLIHSSVNPKIRLNGLVKYSQWNQKAKLWLKSLPFSSDFLEKAEKRLGKDVLGERCDVLEFQDLTQNVKEAGNHGSEVPLQEDAIFRTNPSVFYARSFGWLECFDGS